MHLLTYYNSAVKSELKIIIRPNTNFSNMFYSYSATAGFYW